MAPPISVPANFGRQHIGSPTHSNLTLNLKEGKTSGANSLILAYNSPVIEDLVARLQITSLDVDDFQEAAVGCFVDCMYTGEVELMDKGTFRDVHKMGNVFEVAWLVARCIGYFEGLVGRMNSESHEEMLFLFEEAAYVFAALKERHFLDLAIGKISAGKSKASFITKYMGTYTSLSVKQLDLVIELAGTDVQIVVQSLTSQLSQHLSLHGAVLTDNSRHLLDNVDLALCRRNDKMAYENMFDVLQEFGNSCFDDLKWVLALHRKSSKDSGDVKPAAAGPLDTKISNLFHSFDRFENLTFDELVDALGNDAEVKNLLMFAEALYIWMVKNEAVSVSFSPALLQKILTIKQKRNWGAVPKQCFQFVYGISNTFLNKWRECEALFVSDNNKLYHFINCHNPAEINAEKLVTAEHKLIFYLSEQEYDTKNCKQEGRCGFILKTTPATEDNPEMFDIKLCTDHSEYPPEVHLHEDVVRAENMHFIMEWKWGIDWFNDPVSWWGKPARDGDYWCWGDYWMDPVYSCRIKVLLTV